MYPVQKDVPPPDDGKAGRIAKYPFAKMVANDSFVVDPADDDTAKGVCARVRAAAHNWTKRNASKLQFVVRVVREVKDPTFSSAAVERVRVWALPKSKR